MSDAVRKVLIDLFAKLSCAQIEADTRHACIAFGLASYEEVEALADYASEYHLVRRIRRSI